MKRWFTEGAVDSADELACTSSKRRKKRKSLTKLDDAVRKRRLRQTESFSKRERELELRCLISLMSSLVSHNTAVTI